MPVRIAVVFKDRCQPKRCHLECVAFCPPQRTGTEVIWIDPETTKAAISEETCISCGICVRKCPFDAIRIIGLPEALKEDLVHQYGKNAFRLFRLPVPKKGEVIGLLGPNGIGKTTCVSLLSGEVAPNLGHYRRKKAYWEEVLDYFAGTELHDYLAKIANKKPITAIKPQYVDKLSKIYTGRVRDLLTKADKRGRLAELIVSLDLASFLDRDIAQLSGGELQRMAIAATMLKEADIYFFDEPSSYLDIYQRLQVAKVIQSLSKEKYVVVVEHDLAVLDFLADTVFLMYGEEGAYGIIAQPRPVRTAINVYLGGYLKEENIRFRDREIRFDTRPPRSDWKAETLVTFDELTKRFEGFELTVHPGRLRKGEVVGVVGPNATGKTTFVKMLAGQETPTSGAVEGQWQVSYKPQYLEAVYEGTVGELLRNTVGKKADTGYFETEILQPLKVKGMLERDVSTLSGGELQRVAIALCLGRDADIYLLDEPSAYLDSNQRMEAARTIRRVMEREARTGLIVDHDVYFIDMVSDSIMVFSGDPGRTGVHLHLYRTRFAVTVSMFRGSTTRRSPSRPTSIVPFAIPKMSAGRAAIAETSRGRSRSPVRIRRMSSGNAVATPGIPAGASSKGSPFSSRGCGA